MSKRCSGDLGIGEVNFTADLPSFVLKKDSNAGTSVATLLDDQASVIRPIMTVLQQMAADADVRDTLKESITAITIVNDDEAYRTKFAFADGELRISVCLSNGPGQLINEAELTKFIENSF